MGINSCGTTLIDNGTFKNIGAISWDTTAKTAGFTAVAGNGYFVNTTSGAITVTLPSSPTAGDAVAIADYANTADTNKIIINPNGNNIQGSASNFDLNTEGGTILLIYVDATQGWLSVDSAVASDISEQATFITATGGTITTSGDYKIHTFTSPGTFTVTGLGNPTGGPNNVDYLVVAGGGGGGTFYGAAGGAGGYRESHCATNSGCYTASPKATATSLPISVTGYPITVGGGGSSVPSSPGTQGSNSIFSTITSTGGGYGGGGPSGGIPGGSGGSGGGGGGPSPSSGGSGNTPPVSPPQGNSGGGSGLDSMGAGGGATASGASAPGAVPGGAGAGTQINPAVGESGPSCLQYFSGGGGGFSGPAGPYPSPGGIGGGGDGATPSATGTNATANTGGGAGADNANGGSGIVIIRYKYQ